MTRTTTRRRHQKAVLWAATGNYPDWDGEPEVGAGAEIDVRWEWGKRDGLDARGNTITIEATVVVGQEIAVGSKMWLGKLADYTAGETVLYVTNYREVPDTKGRKYRRVVSLSRHSDVAAV